MYETPQTPNPTVNKPLQPSVDIGSMPDEAIHALVKSAYKELEKRQRQKEKAAKEEIKKMAAQAGINVSFDGNKPKRRKRANNLNNEEL